MTKTVNLHRRSANGFPNNRVGNVDDNMIVSDDLTEEQQEDFERLFKKFCESSTIHGTYFWTASRSVAAKVAWGIIVLLGIISATFIINSSFEGWRANPVITSVMQKSIEEVNFPAITICPMEDTRFGFVEKVLRKRRKSIRTTPVDLVMSLAKEIRRKMSGLAEMSDCLMNICLNYLEDSNESNTKRKECDNETDFLDFIEKAINEADDYEWFISKIIEDHFQMRGSRSLDLSATAKLDTGNNCSRYVRDFRFVRSLREHIPKEELADLSKTSKAESLLKMLFYLFKDEPEKQNQLFTEVLNNEDFPEVYGCWNSESGYVPVPSLVAQISSTSWKDNLRLTKQCNLSNISHTLDVEDMMSTSLHPPHFFDSDFKEMNPNPAFPLCLYDNQMEQSANDRVSEYPELKFCNDFQTTFNDHGLCYTYNNVQLGGGKDSSKKSKRPNFVKSVRKVTGCGKEKGLQLILDNHKLSNLLLSKDEDSKTERGFKVFITVPGVVTSKVPFTIDPTFEGSYSFYLHGIHNILTTKAFRDWNEDAKICNFPADKNLSLFSHYSQDNCLLECRMRKLALKCGCTPWYMSMEDLGFCDIDGNRCIETNMRAYRDDLKDRQNCGCPNDCEMVHFFATLQREPFELMKDVPKEKWFNVRDGSGLLSNYLLDPSDVFMDPLTKRLLILAYDAQNFTEIANLRFQKDISIINFFFDTPIITQINLELKTNIFDMISAIGGTLGLFTGISVITFVETFYWIFMFLYQGMRGVNGFGVVKRWIKRDSSRIKKKSSSSRELIAQQETNELTVMKSRNDRVASYVYTNGGQVTEAF